MSFATLFAIVRCREVDPRFARIDRFLEQSYKQRSLRKTDFSSKDWQNLKPKKYVGNVKANEVVMPPDDDWEKHVQYTDTDEENHQDNEGLCAYFNLIITA